MRRLFSTVIFAASVSYLAACSDIDELRSDVDDLKSRVTALEKQVETFNEQIEALQLLVGASTINTVTETENGYQLLMSNGQLLTLECGVDGEGITPILSIDTEGYWMVDYQDGAGSRRILCGEEPVKALGLDGVTPVFGVDADGYWTLDLGAGPVPVLDAQNNKVKATTEFSAGNPFISSAIYDESGDVLVVELKDESKTVLKIPVVSTFLFAIENAEGQQEFQPGETKVYNVTRKSVGTTVVTRPEGWTVRLTEAELSVTAPAENTTRAAIADTRSDVAILAYCSSDNFVTIAKLKVAMAGAGETHTPQASIYAEGEPTISTIGYLVSLSDATSYKYVFRKTSEGAPSLEEVAEQGVSTTESSLFFDNLEARTEYTLYVLPYYEEIEGAELASLAVSTAAPVYTSYYEAYNADEVLTIGGVAVSRALFGEGTLLTAEDNLITADGVYFVPEGVTARYGSDAGIRGTLIIIGDNPAARSDFALVGTVTCIEFDPAQNGSFMLYNLNFRVATDNGEGHVLFFPNNANGGTMQNVVCESCRLDLSGLQGFSFTTDSRSADKLIRLNRVAFVDCDICVGSGTRFGYFFQYRTDAAFGDFIFRNNVVWSSSEDNATRLLNCSKGISAADFAKAAPVERFEMVNNTWIYCKGMPLNYVRSVGEYVLRNNLFYGKISRYTPVMRYSETEELDGSPKTGAVYDNLGYVMGGASVCWKAANPNDLPLVGYKQIINSKEDPFAGGTFNVENGIFIPNSSYASYGAQRQ